MARQYEDRITFIGVAGNDSIDRMEEFVRRHEVGFFPQAATENGDLWAKWGINYQPAFVLIDADGEIAYKATRPDPEELRAQLDAIAS